MKHGRRLFVITMVLMTLSAVGEAGGPALRDVGKGVRRLPSQRRIFEATGVSVPADAHEEAARRGSSSLYCCTWLNDIVLDPDGTDEMPLTYTATGTMYVHDGNPSSANYQSTADAEETAQAKADRHLAVLRSDAVLLAVQERLAADHPDMTVEFIAGTLSIEVNSEMESMLTLRCTTQDARLSADICNALVDIAPGEMKRMLSAVCVSVIDYAAVPQAPDAD